MKYRVADLTFNMVPDKITKKQAKKYLYQGAEQPLFEIKPSDYEKYIKNGGTFKKEAFEYLTCGENFYRKLFEYSGIYIHSSAVVVNDRAYLFSANSGTGKSTHTSKWLEIFGDKAFIINDDKPAIRILEDGIYVYGTPWSGKHDISVNAKVPIGGICFLERAEENWIKSMDPLAAWARVYHGGKITTRQDRIEKYTAVVDELVKRVPIWEMGCTPTVEAAKMAYEAMSAEEIK